MIARVPLTPRLTLRQKQSRPAPNGDTTPSPLMTTRGSPFGLHGVTIIPAVQRDRRRYPPWLARPMALGGLIFFVDALLYFAVPVHVRVRPRGDSGNDQCARAIAIDVLLFSVFALHHSVFARDRFP